MRNVDHPAISSPRDHASWRHRTDHGWRSLSGGWRGPLAVTALAMALAALAISQNWIAFAALLPLLYLLPCAAMMYVCMKKH